jgi:hypothetical protein
MYIETITAKSFIMFNSVCFLFKIELLSTNIELTLHRAFIRSVITYAFPAWEFAANTYLLKFRCLQNKFLNTIGNFPRGTQTHELHVAFSILYMYDFIMKLCRQQADVI